jgi:putative N-acetyltransferase (TIGR04045 family)
VDVLLSRSSSPPETVPAEPTHVCRPVRTPAERAEHVRIRREVFVVEQGLFAADDADEHDDDPATVHVLGLVGGQPAGTVRLYPLEEPGLWKGDRLAVRRAYRRSGIGAPLVRFAVALAGARGGTRMVASVQAVNCAFFVRLGWTPTGDVFNLLGVPHQPMSIPLASTPLRR